MRRNRGRRTALQLAAGALAFVVYNIHHWWNAPGDDWSSIWVAAAMVGRGRADLLYDVDPHRFTDVGDPATWMEYAAEAGRTTAGHPYVHEPGFAYALSVFAGPGTWSGSVRALTAVSVLAVLATVWIIGRTWAPMLLQPVPFAAVLLVLSISEPLRNALWLGQTTPVILLLTIGGVALARRHPVLAGLILALPVSIKITPVLIAVWWLVDRRRRKALSGLAAGLGVLGLVQLLLVDWSVLRTFVATLRHVQQTTTTGWANQSLVGWLADFSVSEHPGSYPTLTIPTWISAVSTGSLLLVVAAVVLRAMHLQRTGLDAERFATAGLLTASLPFTPLSWTHYYLLLLVPAAVLLQAAVRSGLRWPYLVVTALVALSTQPLAHDDSMLASTPDAILRAHLLTGVLALVALFALPRHVWLAERPPLLTVRRRSQAGADAGVRRPPLPRVPNARVGGSVPVDPVPAGRVGHPGWRATVPAQPTTGVDDDALEPSRS